LGCTTSVSTLPRGCVTARQPSPTLSEHRSCPSRDMSQIRDLTAHSSLVTALVSRCGSALTRRGRCAEGGTPDPCPRDHPARPGVKLERPQAAHHALGPSQPAGAGGRGRTSLTPAAVGPGGISRRVRVSAERGRVQGPGRAEADLGPRTLPATLLHPAIPSSLQDGRQRFLGPPGPPRIGPRRGPLIPPLMGPPTPPLMGPPQGWGTRGSRPRPVCAGQTLRGAGSRAKTARDPAPLRYVGVRPINRSPVDGSPSSAHSGRNSGGRTIEPALRAGRAFARNLRKPTCGHAAIPRPPQRMSPTAQVFRVSGRVREVESGSPSG
jgi:hypothetical protein